MPAGVGAGVRGGVGEGVGGGVEASGRAGLDGGEAAAVKTLWNLTSKLHSTYRKTRHRVAKQAIVSLAPTVLLQLKTEHMLHDATQRACISTARAFHALYLYVQPSANSRGY